MSKNVAWPRFLALVGLLSNQGTALLSLEERAIAVLSPFWSRLNSEKTILGGLPGFRRSTG
ncbi:MAG: hypothetical protein LBT38_07405 [Deltaproteobacteria bacterium]|nr:hypothetical protein [Deltaproteobacteria bacterium]